MLSGEQFLEDLYGEICEWAQTSGGMKEVGAFSPQRIDDFDSVAGRERGDPVPVDIDLERGVICGKKGLMFGLVLGEGSNFSGEKVRRLMFGGLYKTPTDREDTTRDLSLLVRRKTRGFLHGEFYFSPTWRQVAVYCWADSHMYGGPNIERGWDQERLLSENGIKACVDLVERTVKRSKY